MGLGEFKANVEAVVRQISKQEKGDKTPLWLDERALTGMEDAGFEALPADLGFHMGAAVARFRRITKEVAEADGIADRQQSAEAAAALRTISEILKSLPFT